MGTSLPPKEANLFKSIVKAYETKQYKKGLRSADSILKKFPNHGETMSMKGLILNCMDRKAEAYDLVRQGLKNDLRSHVCWHVHGLLYRSDREYGEAIKCYKNALRHDPENIEILRDLSLLQVQTRDLSGFVETRQQLLTLKPNHRMNWIGFAVAQHLNGNPKKAAEILDAYEGTLEEDYPPDNERYEHSEMLLYKELRKGPVIEELSDDDETPPSESKSNNKEEPIVEHPDDDGHHEHESRYTPRRSETRYTPQHHHPPQYQQSTTSRSFCYSSSTMSGPGGVFYTSSSKRRINPNGVIEEEFHEKDGSSGTENKRFAVSIGDKMHAVAKKRNSDGTENTLETLHNLREDEVVKFDRAWGKHLAGTSSSTSDRYELLEDKPNDQSRGSHSQPLFLKGARDEYDIKKH